MDAKTQVQYNLGFRELINEESKNVYEIKTLGGLSALTTFTQLVSLVGPTIASVFDKKDEDDFEESTMLTEAVILLIKRMEESNIQGIITKILKDATKNGKTLDIEEDFRGDFDELVDLIAFALKENYQKAFIKWLKVKGLTLPTLGQKDQATKGTTPSKLESV